MSTSSDLEDLYARVPTVACKGLCQDSCGQLVMSTVEAQRLTRRTGESPSYQADGHCSYLKDGRCSVYAQRPLVCRLWGAVDEPTMRCPHGCAPAEFVSLTKVQQLYDTRTQRFGPKLFQAQKAK